ncbi:hypothetical protein BWI15_22765 [Kribbella sp. ALI-6-A]|uniref:hypothetical protein n=1 Tax=Kribbella sp. ALI-6-A TaxID=1933817 RepID=UPI00097C3BC4|nr:hypothetical protein [Kribbella sp. ALI-6-A]ONI69409.1 hypothetical protein BWI15_22765 [Kribbella sp. ALI-6-A]
MPLVDLDDPEELRARWSALAAVAHATGFDRRWYADADGWYHQDETGSDLRMVRLDGGRSVLFGYHTQHSRTAGTDLLAGAPDWIGQPEVKQRIAAGTLGFVYGSFNGTWARASYEGDPWQPVDDGFAPIGQWITSDEESARELVEWAAEWADYLGGLDELLPLGVALIRSAAESRLSAEELDGFFARLGIGPRSPQQPDLYAALAAAAQFDQVVGAEAAGPVGVEPVAAPYVGEPYAGEPYAGEPYRGELVGEQRFEESEEEDEEELFIVPPGVSPFTNQPITDDADPIIGAETPHDPQLPYAERPPYEPEPPYNPAPAYSPAPAYEPPAPAPESPPADYGVVSKKPRLFGRKKKQREEENSSLAGLGLAAPDPEPAPAPPTYDRPLPSSEPPRVGAPVEDGEDFYASLFADGPAAVRYTPDTPTAQHPAASPDDATSELAAVPTGDETAPFTPFTPDAKTAGTPFLEDRAGESPYAPETPAEGSPASAEGHPPTRSPFAADYDESAPSGSPFAPPADDQSAVPGSPFAPGAGGQSPLERTSEPFRGSDALSAQSPSDASPHSSRESGSPAAPSTEATRPFAPEMSPTSASDDTGVLNPVEIDDRTSIADDDTGALAPIDTDPQASAADDDTGVFPPVDAQDSAADDDGAFEPVDADPQASASDDADSDRRDLHQQPAADLEPQPVEPDDDTGAITPVAEPSTIDALTADRDDKRWSATDADARPPSADGDSSGDAFTAGRIDEHRWSGTEDDGRASSADDDSAVDAFTAGRDDVRGPSSTHDASRTSSVGDSGDVDDSASGPEDVARSSAADDEVDLVPPVADAGTVDAFTAGDDTGVVPPITDPSSSAKAAAPTPDDDTEALKHLGPTTSPLDPNQPTSLLDVEQPVGAQEPAAFLNVESPEPVGTEEPTAFLDVPQSASSAEAEDPTSPLDVPPRLDGEQPTAPLDVPSRFDGDQPTAQLDALEPTAPQDPHRPTSPLDDFRGASDTTAESVPPSPMEREWVGGAWINGEWIEDAAAYLAANPHLAHPPRPARRQRRNHPLDPANPDHSSDAPSHQVAHQYGAEADPRDVRAVDQAAALGVRADDQRAAPEFDEHDADVRGTADVRDGEAGVRDDVEVRAADGVGADVPDDDELDTAEAPRADDEAAGDGPVVADIEDGNDEAPTAEIAALPSEPDEDIARVDSGDSAAVGDGPRTYPPLSDQYGGSADDDYEYATDVFHDEILGSADWTADQLGESAGAPASVEASGEGRPEVEGEASGAPTVEVDDPTTGEPPAAEVDEAQDPRDEALAEESAEDLTPERTAEDLTPETTAEDVASDTTAEDVASETTAEDAAPEETAAPADPHEAAELLESDESSDENESQEAAAVVAFDNEAAAGVDPEQPAEVVDLDDASAEPIEPADLTETDEPDGATPEANTATELNGHTPDNSTGRNGHTPPAAPTTAPNGQHPDPAATMLIPELTNRGTPVPFPLGVEQAMRAEPERPRPKPAESPAFEALRAWCRVRTNVVPSGFTIQVQVLDPARPSYRFDLEPADVDDPEWPDERLSELLGDLWIAEAQSEHGGWLFARIDAAGRTLRIDRWYDQVPEWWDTNLPSELDVEGLVRRLYRRGFDWQPSYLEQLYITAG